LSIVLRDSFLRACRRLTKDEHAALMQIFVDLRGNLADPARHTGLGLRKVNPHPLWEARLGLRIRVLFRLEDDHVIFVFLGTHDEVQAFVRHYKHPAPH
jgi:mRNA-degrading endonuclease RelE of RelBE toxin-antitoxin system